MDPRAAKDESWQTEANPSKAWQQEANAGNSGLGLGNGLGSGLGNGQGLGDDESIALTLTAPVALTATVPVVQKKTRQEETEQQEIKQQTVQGQSISISTTLAEFLYTCMKEHNPVAFNSAPTKWKQFWSGDIETLLPVYPEKQLRDIITESQINPIYRKLVVRGAGLVKMADRIHDQLMNHGAYSAKASPDDNAGAEDVEGEETAFDQEDPDFADKVVPDVPYVAARWKDRFCTEVDFELVDEWLGQWASIDLFRAFCFVDTRTAWRRFVGNSPVRFNKNIAQIMKASAPGNAYRDPPSECDVEMIFSDDAEKHTQAVGESKEEKTKELASQTALPRLVAVAPDDEQFTGKQGEIDTRGKPNEKPDNNRDDVVPDIPGRFPVPPDRKNAIPAPIEDGVEPAAQPPASSSEGGQRQLPPHRDSIPDPSESSRDERDPDNEVENKVENGSVVSLDSKDVWEWLAPLKGVWKEVSDRHVSLVDFRRILRDHKATIPQDNPVGYLADVIRWTMTYWPKRKELTLGSVSFSRRFGEIQQDYAAAMREAETADEDKVMFLDLDEDL